jgi:hypothetical protein
VSARGALASRPAPAPGARSKARARPRAVPASRRRRRFRLGLAAIPLVAALFAGVVWLNAAKLSVTKRQGQIVRQIAAVGDQIGQLKTVESQENGVVAAWATRQGMVRPGSADLTFVKARPGR